MDPNLQLLNRENNQNNARGVNGGGQVVFTVGTNQSSFTSSGYADTDSTYYYNYRNPGASTGFGTVANANYRGLYNLDGTPNPTTPFPANAFTQAPPEHYVSSGATFASPGSAYHVETGISYNYDPTSDGNPALNPQTDALASGVNQVGAQILGTSASWDAYRDRLRPDPGTGLGNGIMPQLNSVGGKLTYAFWLQINDATSFQNPNQFGTTTMYMIGRPDNNNAGSVTFKDADGSGANSEYAFNGFFSGSPGQVLANNLLVAEDTWHHWVVQYDTALSQATVWLDGGIGNNPFTGQPNKQVITGGGTGAIGGLFRIGNAPGGNQREGGDFYLDELGVWQGVTLTDADVLSLYNNGIVNAVPEPSAIVLGMLSLISLFAVRRRNRNS